MRNRKRGPRARKYRKGRKRAHRRNYAKASMLALRGPTGIPDSMFVKLAYAEVFRPTVVAAQQDYTFKGNDVFDPNSTGVGHQPLYFDQYAAIYQKYRVFGSSIRVDLINVSGDSAVLATVVPHTLVTALTMEWAQEWQRSRTPRIVPIAQRYPIRVKDYTTTRKVIGANKAMMSADDVLTASVTTSPSNPWFWHIIVSSIDGLTFLDLYINVKIVYYVQFYDPQTVSQS